MKIIRIIVFPLFLLILTSSIFALENKTEIRYKEAQRLLYVQKFKEAIEILENITMAPGKEEYKIYSLATLGDFYFRNQEEYKKALEYYSQAMRLFDNFENSGTYRFALLHNFGVCNEKLGNFSSALEIYKKVYEGKWKAHMTISQIRWLEDRLKLLENYSDFKYEPYKLFISVEDKEHYDEDIAKNYEMILSSYPKSKILPLTYFMLGNYYASQIGISEPYRKIDEKEAFNRAVNIFKIVESMKSESKLHNLLRNYFPAGQNISAASQMYIALLYSYYVQGTFPNYLQYYEKAIEEYKKIIEYYPDEKDASGNKYLADSYSELLELYIALKYDYAKIEEVFNILTNKLPNQGYTFGSSYFGMTHPHAYLTMAEVYLSNNQISKAIDCYSIILSNYPKDMKGKPDSCAVGLYFPSALTSLVEVYINKVKNPTELINKLRILIKKCKDENVRLNIQYKIAEIYENHTKDIRQAIIEYKNVVKINPNMPDKEADEDYNTREKLDQNLG